MGQAGAPGDGLDHRHAVGLCERGEFRSGERIVHPAARHDQGLARLAQQLGRRDQLLDVGPRPRHAPDLRLEERLGVIERLGLGVLSEAEENRPAVGRIEHGRDRLGQGGDDLLRPADPVPVARHRLECVVDGDRRIIEVLDLLQHRVGHAIGEGVAGQQQDRQAVAVRHAGRRHHVHGARSDRARRHHDLTPFLGLGVRHAGERHRLLVLAAPGRQLVLHRLERLAEAGDVAVAEDREHAAEQRRVGAIQHRALRAQPPDQGLRHRQPDRLHGLASPMSLLDRANIARRV